MTAGHAPSAARGRGGVSGEQEPQGEGSLGRFKPYPAYRDSGLEWLGKIPCDWTLSPLWAMFRRVKRTDYPEEELLSVYRDYGVIPKASRDDNFNKPSEDLSTYQFVDRRDLVINKMKTWQGSIAVSEHRGIVSPAYHVYSPLHAELDRYIHYLLRSSSYVSGYMKMSKGIRVNQWDLEPEEFSRILIVLPPRNEQRAIAAFLNRETTRLDALIAKKELLIQLLRAQRTVLITGAVTKGLDPNAAMKDSAIAWLGEIPVHWDIKPFIKCIIEKADYRGKTPEKVVSGVFLVTARNVRMGLIDYECSEEFVAPNEYAKIMRRGLPRKGDILFTTEAPLGNVALVDREDVALAQRIIRFRMNQRHFDSRFTLFAMMSDYFQAQLAQLSTGSTAEGLKASKLSMLSLIAPPLAEQYLIVKFLERETTRIDALIGKVREAIDRLTELRSALISAAVTGKIDVREEVA